MDEKIKISFLHGECEHGCGTCKAKIINLGQSPKIHVGDGVSDIFGAFAADVVFAKKGSSLTTYLEKKNIEFIEFSNLIDVLDEIQNISQ